MRRFQRAHSILVMGLCGSCWWAASQPRLLPHPSTQELRKEGRHVSAIHPQLGTALKNGVIQKLVSQAISDRSSAPCLRGRCRAGNQYLVHMEKRIGPTPDHAERNTNFYISPYSSKKTLGVFRVLPQNIRCSQECTKRRNQASVRGCTNPATSLISFNDQHLHQPWCVAGIETPTSAT